MDAGAARAIYPSMSPPPPVPDDRTADEPAAHPGRRFSRAVLAILFATAGVLHFVATEAFVTIIPFLPAPERIVEATGAVEIAAAAGLLLGPVRLTGTLLAIYCAAVLPANIFMALDQTPVAGIVLPVWLLWLRVALQVPLIAWIVWSTRR